MKRVENLSFGQKLLLGFLICGVVPLALFMVVSLMVFSTALSKSTVDTAQIYRKRIEADMGRLFSQSQEAIIQLAESPLILRALEAEEGTINQKVYSELYNATTAVRAMGWFSLYDSQGTLRYTTANPAGTGQLPLNWGVLRAAAQEEKVVFRQADMGTSCLRGAAAVRREDDLLGYVVMEMLPQHFESLLEDSYDADSDIFVVDSFWNHVYSTQDDNHEVAAKLRRQILAGQPLSNGGGEHFYYVQHEEVSGLTFVIQQSYPLSGWVMRLFYFAAGVAIALCLILCVALSMVLSRQLFSPIYSLNHAMAQVEQGNFQVQVDHDRVDEMGQLAARFNRMAEKLGFYLEESLRRQRELNEAQIRMMQAQLNPHFLYNTLDTIKWLGKTSDRPEIATISADLAAILRSSISSEEFVTLAEELHFLEQYVEIQRIRFPGKFDYVTQAEEEALEVMVPKLMLQPLVENAIVHGLDEWDGGRIEVTAKIVGEELAVTVWDDGRGMSQKTIQMAQEGVRDEGHLGLYNVGTILRLHYGKDRGLRFLPAKERGTLIEIVIPCNGKEGEDAKGSGGGG